MRLFRNNVSINKYPERKNLRLKNYDYSEHGVYFITICIKDMKKILSEILYDINIVKGAKVKLTEKGKIVENAIIYIEKNKGIYVENYVIMPNHIHLLLFIDGCENKKESIISILHNFKSYTTHLFKESIWQRSYYDHIVRNEKEYKKIYDYIDNNPNKWKTDKYYFD